jgi:AraC family transcriptional regulator, arabinose operon regulatory protein
MIYILRVFQEVTRGMPVENLKDFTDRVSRDDGQPEAAPIVTGHLVGGRRYGVWRTRGRGDWLLMLTLTGRGRAGKTLLEIGDAVLLKPGFRQDYGTARGASRWEILWVHFQPRPHWREWLLWPEAEPGVLLLRLEGERQDEVAAALWEMRRHATGPLARREDFAMNALEQALLWCETASPAARRLDPRIENAMRFLLENLSRPLTLPEVAQASNLSVSWLSHRFKAEMGQTPLQFLEAERMMRARQLLQLTTRPISAIALEVGFESAIHFSLRFRKLCGVSPRAFRRQMGIITE